MHYTYTLDEKDFKEACFNSVHVLDVLQRNRILFSVIYSLLIFILAPFAGVSLAIITYLILGIAIYFWGYQLRLFNMEKKRRHKPKKWTAKEEVSLFEDKLVQNSHNIKRTIYWKDIVGGYETDQNLILYLDLKKLDFVVIKKPSPFSKDKNTSQFFNVLRAKVEDF